MAAQVFKRRLAKCGKTITIEQATKTPDGQGGFTTTWATFATPTALVKYLNMDEQMKDGGLDVRQLIRFKIEYITGVVNTMRVNYNGDTMPIIGNIDQNDNNDCIELIVRREAAT